MLCLVVMYACACSEEPASAGPLPDPFARYSGLKTTRKMARDRIDWPSDQHKSHHCCGPTCCEQQAMPATTLRVHAICAISCPSCITSVSKAHAQSWPEESVAPGIPSQLFPTNWRLQKSASRLSSLASASPAVNFVRQALMADRTQHYRARLTVLPDSKRARTVGFDIRLIKQYWH